MASTADSSSRQAAIRKQNKGPPFKFLVPLIYAPVLPLIRITLRKNPVLRDRVFGVVLAGAFAHGFYLVEVVCVDSLSLCVILAACFHGGHGSDLYDAESKS